MLYTSIKEFYDIQLKVVENKIDKLKKIIKKQKKIIKNENEKRKLVIII